MVCDTEEEAKRLSFEQNISKTVTLDGTVIRSSGTMEGGLGGVEGKAHRWEEKHVESLRQEKEACQDQLNELRSTRRKQQQLEALDSKIKGYQSRLAFGDADVKMQREKLKANSDEIAEIQRQLDRLEPEIARADADASRFDADVQRLRQAIDRYDALLWRWLSFRVCLRTPSFLFSVYVHSFFFLVHLLSVVSRAHCLLRCFATVHLTSLRRETDRIFAAFCRSLNIPNIREYEEKVLTGAQVCCTLTVSGPLCSYVAFRSGPAVARNSASKSMHCARKWSTSHPAIPMVGAHTACLFELMAVRARRVGGEVAGHHQRAGEHGAGAGGGGQRAGEGRCL